MLNEDFNKVYKQSADLVYNLCLNYLQNTSEAEEACQNVFVKVYSKYNQFKAESELQTWIYRIAINECLDRIKSTKRKKRLSIFQVFSNEQSEANAFRENNHPGIQLEDKEAINKILSAINELPENQKTAIILKSIEGLSQKEISQIMETSEKAVESLLSRARANLKTKLTSSEGKKY
jgi:RNA polymerase sigma-70 factor, ECF subfamily